MQYPLLWNGIKVPFGIYNDKNGKKVNHKGIDFGWNLVMGGLHQKVYAVDDGIIYDIQVQKTGGNVIIIKHNGYFSEYGHLKNKTIQVKKNQKIKRGDYLANMGDTGESDGIHLHFGLYKSDTFSYNMNRWVNPINYLELYENQHFMPGTIKEYGDKLKYHKEYEKGVYKTLYDMNIRKAPNGEKVKVKDCTDEMKKALTSKSPNAYAVVKKGTNFTALEIVKKDGYWAKNYSGYICIEQNNNIYCKKV